MNKGGARPKLTISEDESAVSVVIGVVLLLGIAVILLALVQAAYVPQWNKEIEFDHNQKVQSDIQNLRDSVLTTAARGGTSSVSVKMGTEYPNRVVLYNPANPTGGLFTSLSENMSLSNVAVSGEANDYWAKSSTEPIKFSTKTLFYRPNYNEYKNAPLTFYENTVVYNSFNRFAGNVSLTLSEQALVSGRNINLVTLQANLSKESGGSETLEIKPGSAPSQSVAITNSGGPITIEIPTLLPNSTWEDLLQGEYASNGGHIVNQGYTETPGREPNILTLEFEQGVTYDLTMAKIGINRVDQEGSHYAVDAEGDDTSVPEGGSQKLVVEVRDEYNNPVSGATVNFSINDTGSLNTDGNHYVEKVMTDSQGRANVKYIAPDDITGERKKVAEINASININSSKADSNFDPGTMENVTFEVEVQNTDGSGLGGGGGSGGGGAYDINWEDPNGQPGTLSTPCDADYCTYNQSADPDNPGTLTLTADTTPTADDANVDFSVNDTTIATVNPNSATTNSQGKASTELEPKDNGTVAVYVSSGGSGDVINVTIKNATGGSGGGSNTAPNVNFTYSPDNPDTSDTIQFTDQSSDSDGTIQSWSWDFGDGDTSSQQNPTHSYTDNGTYTVTLTVTDDDGATNSTTKQVQVDNLPPTAEFTPTCSGLECEFDASASTDSDGSISSYSWNFGDGDTGSGQVRNHTYSSSGTYTVTLTTTDDDGATNSTSKTVTVSPSDTNPPTVTSASITNAPINESDTGTSQTVTVNFNESMDTSVNPTVEITGLSTSYTVSGSWSDSTTWTGSVTLNDDNEEATATIEVSGAQDTAGNTQSPNPDTSNTFQVDTKAPTISNFDLSNPNGKNLRVTFDSDESLAQIEVEITDSAGNTEIVFTRSDFTETCSGGTCSYEANYNPGGPHDTYTATLLTAKDSFGNDGASGQTDSVNTQGNQPPTADFNAYVTDYDGDGDDDIVYDASPSSDPDGSISTYEWDYDGDGTYEVSTNNDLYVNDAFAGIEYGDVTLRVTDNDGATDTVTQSNEPQPTPGFLVFAVILTLILGETFRRRRRKTED